MGNELLASLLLTALAAFGWSHFLDWNHLPDAWQQRRPLLTTATGVGVLFLALFLVLRAFLAAQAADGSASPGVAAQSPVKGAPDQWQDRQEGYRAGHALGSSPSHHGGKVPRPTALAALAAIRCQGRSAGYLEGFEQGFVAGLAPGPSSSAGP